MIKRYEYTKGEIGGNDSILTEREDGEYVKYEDVEEFLSPWKDASKELPREDVRVLIKGDPRTKKVNVAILCSARGDWRVGDFEAFPTHWMYIPEVNNE